MGIQERKQREFERRERDILKAALALFDGNNWNLVTVAEIARRAEIGKGTVYKHFVSKEEIYAKLALNFGNALLRELEKIDPQQPPQDFLRELIGVSLRYHFEHGEYARVAQYSARKDFRQRLDDSLRRAFEETEQRFFHLSHGALARGVEDGVFESKPITHHHIGLTATFQGAVTLAWDLDSGRPFMDVDIETFASAVTDYMLAGLSPKRPEVSTSE